LKEEATAIQAKREGQISRRSWPAADIIRKEKRLKHKQQ
jgi:hypothetical protein